MAVPPAMQQQQLAAKTGNECCQFSKVALSVAASFILWQGRLSKRHQSRVESRQASRRVMFQQMQIAHTTRWQQQQQQQRRLCSEDCNVDWGIDSNQLVCCFAGHWVNSLNINYQLSYFIDKLCADYRDTDRVAYTCPCMYEQYQ